MEFRDVTSSQECTQIASWVATSSAVARDAEGPSMVTASQRNPPATRTPGDGDATVPISRTHALTGSRDGPLTVSTVSANRLPGLILALLGCCFGFANSPSDSPSQTFARPAVKVFAGRRAIHPRQSITPSSTPLSPEAHAPSESMPATRPGPRGLSLFHRLHCSPECDRRSNHVVYVLHRWFITQSSPATRDTQLPVS